ncbi:hypothetical protein [Alienimonas chondri]|nr:hypothetical protein [Alienimonas chondri]
MPSSFGCGEAVRRALRPAAKIAAGEAVSTRELTAAEDVIVATVARLGRGDSDDGTTDPPANARRTVSTERAVALTANSAYAALAAASAVAEEGAGSRSIRGHRAVLSAVTAAEAAADACPAIRIGMRRDFGLLTRLNLGAFPDPGRGVDVSDGGPLGTCGDDGRRDAAFEANEEAEAEAERTETGRAEAEEAATGVVEANEAAVPPRDSEPADDAAPAAAPPPTAQRPRPELLALTNPFSDIPGSTHPFSLATTWPSGLTDPFANPFALPSAAERHCASTEEPATRSRSETLSRSETPSERNERAEPDDAGGGPARRSAALARKEATLSTRDAALCTREAELAKRSADLADREADAADREADLEDLEAALEERAMALDAATRAVAERAQTAAGELAAARAERQELEEAVAALHRVFAQHPVLSGPPRRPAPRESASPASVLT